MRRVKKCTFLRYLMSNIKFKKSINFLNNYVENNNILCYIYNVRLRSYDYKKVHFFVIFFYILFFLALYRNVDKGILHSLAAFTLVSSFFSHFSHIS